MVGCARMHISSDVLDWQVFQCGVAALDGAALRPPFFFSFPGAIIQICSVSQTNEWHENQSIKNVLPFIMEFPLSKDM